MAIFLSLTALALLALIVYLLHAHQQQQKIDSVDRAVPLPPLEGEIHLPDAEAPIPAVELTPEPEPPVPVAAVAQVVPSADWLARSRTLKEQGDFDQALEIARSAYPQIGAFRQACVILRAQLRE